MKLLALDTGGEACSAALWIGGEVEERFVLAPRGHSELILSMTGELLADAGLSRRQLDAVAFGRGPGSFTGVRIAAGVTQGIAYALDIPAVPVSSLGALAQGCAGGMAATRVLSAFDARMGEVYWGAYETDARGLARLCGSEQVCRPQEVPLPDGGHWLGAGGGWAAYEAILKDRLGDRLERVAPDAQVHARDVATLGAALFAAGDFVSAAQARPVYLRDQVAQKPRPRSNP
ncbi:MAG: tRNA (adenosine(37)-N6)-threonylcarbamoyltransferase complex dimerization subunit type 1 TsaB [Pseudomonadota bacterium]